MELREKVELAHPCRDEWQGRRGNTAVKLRLYTRSMPGLAPGGLQRLQAASKSQS